TAARSNGGRSKPAATSAAATRPPASTRGTYSARKDETCASIQAHTSPTAARAGELEDRGSAMCQRAFVAGGARACALLPGPTPRGTPLRPLARATAKLSAPIVGRSATAVGAGAGAQIAPEPGASPPGSRCHYIRANTQPSREARARALIAPVW